MPCPGNSSLGRADMHKAAKDAGEKLSLSLSFGRHVGVFLVWTHGRVLFRCTCVFVVSRQYQLPLKSRIEPLE